MAFTNVWTTNRPTGAQPAKLADDEIRALRTDMEERLGSIFVDFAADPLVVKPEYGGPVTGKIMTIHHSAYVLGSESTMDTFWTSAYRSINTSAATTFFAPVILPVGVVITKFATMLSASNQGVITSQLRSCTFTTAAAISTLFSVNGTGGSVAIFTDTTSPDHTVIDGAYFLELTIPAGANGVRIYSSQITYDVPSGNKTL